MREKISACITAGNEEAHIRNCLESVMWTDEIVVIDSFSKDKTAEICKEYTNMVYQHRWLGYIGQKNLIKELASGSWIFFVDADETVSKDLKTEILAEFESGNSNNYNGYEFPRMVKYLGRWIKHGDWYPDIKLRLFRKDSGHCTGKEPHDRIHVDGKVKRLKSPLCHFTYNDISDQIATINRFSSISASGNFEDGQRFHYMDIIFRPVFKFMRSYFIKRGFLDGFPGFIVAISISYSVFIKYAKLWEIEKGLAGKQG